MICNNKLSNRDRVLFYRRPYNQDYTSTRWKSVFSIFGKKLQLICNRQIKLKLVSWLVLTVGLIWQIGQISIVYFGYSTRVDVVVRLPEKLTLPALSICVHYNITIYSDEELLYKSIATLFDLPTVNIQISCRTPFPELKKIDPTGDESCENYVEPKWSILYSREIGNVLKCITYFNQPLGRPPIQVIASNDKDFYKVEFIATDNLTFGVMIHNPHEIIHGRDGNPVRIHTDQSEVIVVTNEMTAHFLSAPYKTDCVNYNDLPFGRLSCVYNCRIKQTWDTCSVWPDVVPATEPLNLTFIKKGNHCDQSWQHICDLVDNCKIQCSSHWFSTMLLSVKEKSQPSNVTRLYVRRPLGLQRSFKYVPKMEQIEYICYVTSCFGIWFGISVLDIVQFSVNSDLYVISSIPIRKSLTKVKRLTKNDNKIFF